MWLAMKMTWFQEKNQVWQHWNLVSIPRWTGQFKCLNTVMSSNQHQSETLKPTPATFRQSTDASLISQSIPLIHPCVHPSHSFHISAAPLCVKSKWFFKSLFTNKAIQRGGGVVSKCRKAASSIHAPRKIHSLCEFNFHAAAWLSIYYIYFVFVFICDQFICSLQTDPPPPSLPPTLPPFDGNFWQRQIGPSVRLLKFNILWGFHLLWGILIGAK